MKLAKRTSPSELDAELVDGVSPAEALKAPGRVRSVAIGPKDAIPPALGRLTELRRLAIQHPTLTALPSFLAKLTKLRELTLECPALKTLPPWLGELHRLRKLVVRCTKINALPRSVFALARLTHLDLLGTKIARLDGIENLPRLGFLQLARTPLAPAKKLAELAARWPDSETAGATIWIERDASRAKPPKGRAALARAIALDQLDDTAALPGADLSGQRFADVCLASQELGRADLRRTHWTQCEFGDVDLGRANLEGAVFERCRLEDTSLVAARARGAVFRDCYLWVDLSRADLRDARFVEVQPESPIVMTQANARGLRMSIRTNEPNAAYIIATGADLRDASIAFDLSPRARAALEAKPARRPTWYEAQLGNIKRSARTAITYAPFPAVGVPMPKAAPSGGARAEAIGKIYAPNASLWCLVGDAEVVAAWRGDEGYDYDAPIASSRERGNAKTDFGRAMAIGQRGKRQLAVGDGEGVVVQIGTSGASPIWRIDGGIAMMDFFPSEDVDQDDAALASVLAERVIQLPTVGKPTLVGQVEVASGALAMLLPFTKGDFSAAQRRAGARGAKAREAGEFRTLVPLARGTYQIWQDPLGKGGVDGDGFQDELGQLVSRTRIVAKPRG